MNLPDDAPPRHRDILTDRRVEIEVVNGAARLPVSQTLAILPLCVPRAE